MGEDNKTGPSVNCDSLTFQWAQLLALAFAHFVVDIFPGMLHSILPAVQTHFGFGVARGGIILTSYLLVSNGIQLLTGHLRENRRRPFFIYLGLSLAVVLCLLNILPASPSALPAVIALCVISAAGTGIVHPEGLRGIHTLDKIPPAVSTSVFMACGILGFAAGGYTSTALVDKFGLKGIYVFALCSGMIIILIALLRIRLAVDSKSENSAQVAGENIQPPFALIMLMATLAAISTAVIVWLLPQRLHQLGFELTFGGLSVMFFSLAGGVGSFLWAAVAGKKGELKTACTVLVVGLPFFIAYDLLIEHKAAVWLLFIASFCCFGAYPLMVTLGRYSKGLTLGRRMGLIVGGTWLISSVFPMILAPIAERIGMQTILVCANTGYLLSAILGLYIQRRLGIKLNKSFLPGTQ
jgi:MFS family permease